MTGLRPAFFSTMKVECIDSMGADLDIARAAWVSTHGERPGDEQDEQRVAGLIGFLMRDRHGSPFEQGVLKFRTKCPIFVWREHDRHRIGVSKNEQSGRYMRLAPEFYIPSEFRPLIQQGKPGAYTFVPGTEAQYTVARQRMEYVCHSAYAVYEEMMDAGIAKEVARMVLPLNIYSTSIVQFNLRSLMHFLSLRTKDSSATFPSFPQREIEMVAEEYEWHFEDKFPLVHAAFVKNGRVAP